MTKKKKKKAITSSASDVLALAKTGTGDPIPAARSPTKAAGNTKNRRRRKLGTSGLLRPRCCNEDDNAMTTPALVKWVESGGGAEDNCNRLLVAQEGVRYETLRFRNKQLLLREANNDATAIPHPSLSRNALSTCDTCANQKPTKWC